MPQVGRRLSLQKERVPNVVKPGSSQIAALAVAAKTLSKPMWRRWRGFLRELDALP